MKYALVTGGSRGIGRAVSIRLSQMGYVVIINYHTNEKEAATTLSTIQNMGGCAELLPFDVSDRETTQVALDDWQQQHPDDYIEVLVNNAGIRRDTLMVFMKYEDFDQVLRTNLFSFYNVTQPLPPNNYIVRVTPLFLRWKRY